MSFARRKLAIFPAEVQQRVSLADDHIFHFGDEDGVIAGILRRVQTAFQVGERSVQNGGAVGGTVEARAERGGIELIAVGAGVKIGNRLLIGSQHIYSETLLRVEMRMRAGFIIDADQDEQRIERDGAEGVGGHAVNLAVKVDGDDGDSGGEAAQGAAKLGGRERMRHGNGYIIMQSRCMMRIIMRAAGEDSGVREIR